MYSTERKDETVSNISKIFVLLLLHSWKRDSLSLTFAITHPHICGLTLLRPSEAILYRRIDKYFY